MLIIPLTGKTSWRNPPVITISIILINVFIYFIFQDSETDLHYQNADYYFASGLASIEIPHYFAYQKGRVVENTDHESFQRFNDDLLLRYYTELQKNFQFLERLKNDQVIFPSDPVYAKWKILRNRYEEMRLQIVSHKYGFRPAYKNLQTSFTYMFLHGGFGHLLGNMIFLWIVGCILELGCGRLPYVILYLIGGFAAVWLFWLAYMDSTVPLVGASGAIAGLMGAFAVLFGKTRVKIFYSLGFYFNYLKLPAIILLPVWVGNELFQLLLGDARHVAYVAHIGGLAGGALFGYLSLKFFSFDRSETFEEEPQDEISPLLEDALRRIAELDFEAGSRLLEQVLAKEPEHIDALTHLFNVYKLEPEKPRFHKVAKNLIFRLSRSYDTYESAHKFYQEYICLTRRPRLSPQLYIELSSIFSATGHLEHSVNILTLLLKKMPELPGLPSAFLKLAAAYRKNGMAAKWQRCLRLILSKYPESVEAQLARQSLQG
jgi:membrane associated rhomboid family serine protease